MKKSISDRIKITKGGKILRRAMTLGHSRSNKRQAQMLRKKALRILNVPKRTITKYN